MKKNLIVKLVEGLERIKATFKVSYRLIFSLLPLYQATYRRWKSRVLSGKTPLKKPGPKPLKSLDLAKLDAEVNQLVHCKKRTRGVGKLRTAFKGIISRRELDLLVSRSRKNHLCRKKTNQHRLTWHQPGTVWSMDVFQSRFSSQRGFVLSLQDLASGYKLPPLVTDNEPSGKLIALHLASLFSKFGSPLLLKRDNGGNLNQKKIEELLSDYFVLPLNSPGYYAEYNGAIEHAQSEFKQQLRKNYKKIDSFNSFAFCVALAAHDLNHICRRKLDGNTSCFRFFQKSNFKYSKRQRKEVFLWIYERATDIVEKAGKNMSPAAAWRLACKMWLIKNGLLSISKNGEVLPYFSENFAHN